MQIYLASSDHDSLGFAPSEVESLVSNVSRAIGLNADRIGVIPCAGIEKVRSNYLVDDVPKGEYIFYNPIWVREVIGNKIIEGTNIQARDEAIVIFGHELGHILGRHFTANSDLPRLEKETQADHFAGCAAAVMAVKWDDVDNILSRLRGDVDNYYPSREHSLAAASSGYNECRRTPPSSSTFPIAGRSFFGIAVGMPIDQAMAGNHTAVLKNANGANWLTFPGEFAGLTGDVWAKIDDQTRLISEVHFQYQSNSEAIVITTGTQTTQGQWTQRSIVENASVNCKSFGTNFPTTMYSNFGALLIASPALDGRLSTQDTSENCNKVNNLNCTIEKTEGYVQTYKSVIGANNVSATITYAYQIVDQGHNIEENVEHSDARCQVSFVVTG